MITFKIEKSTVIASYTTMRNSVDWLKEKFENDEKYDFQRTFTFGREDLLNEIKTPTESVFPFLDTEIEPIDFLFAKIEGEYFKVKKGVLSQKMDVFIYKDIEITSELFLVESNISIVKKIENLINEDLYVGGSHPNAIDENVYLELINSFPNNYEKKLYAEAKITNLIKEFFATTIDAEDKFQNYLNKKETIVGTNLTKTFKEVELIKYETILEKLTRMLNDENNYSEHQWQKEILDIILLLYPKYILVFTEVPIKADDIKQKYLDFLLIDANGNTDIIEIKKPFENSIMTKGLYRDNYIPLRELSGTVMQIEKYIYYLNRWSHKGENYLTTRYRTDLPQNFDIKITNPSGMIIMGRENQLTKGQKQDFEVVKRKYKNVIDIITYDNLIERLKYTINQIKKI